MTEWWRRLMTEYDLQSLAQPWLPKVVVVILATLALHFVSRKLLNRFARLASKSSSEWDDTLVNSARLPLPILVWILGFSFAADIVRAHEPDVPLLSFVPLLREEGVIICLAWFLLRLVKEIGRHYVAARHAAGEEVDLTTVDALSKLGRLIIVIVTMLVVMQTFGFSVSGILAAGGIGGIAIGFAAKDLLANFFGGLTIYLDRPFSVGDWIRSPDKAIEGTVEVISWRHTRIRAFNKNPIYVPNAVFTTAVIENPSRMSHRRIKETIGIRYDDLGKMAPIVADIKAMLQSHPEIDATQTLIVNFNSFGASSLDFFIYTFTKTREWVKYHEVKQDVLLKVAEIIERHGAEIAFPTHTVHVAGQVPAQAAWTEGPPETPEPAA